MKAKFEKFNDGTARICTVNNDGLLVDKYEKPLRFGEENVSMKRHYAAQAADTRVDKVIHVQQRKDLKAHEVAVIGEDQFDIEKVDQINDTMPPITKLSLIEYEKHRRKDFA
jgi:hypothetical protein